MNMVFICRCLPVYFLLGVFSGGFFFLGGGIFVNYTVRYISLILFNFNMSDITSMTLPTIKILHLPLLSPMLVCFHQGTAAPKLPRCPIGGKFIMITRRPQLKVYNDVSI